MRVVVVGASGNVGTSVLAALEPDPEVREIVAIARRPPEVEPSDIEWVEADITRDDLRPHFEGADAVVHLAWAIQPSRDERLMQAINVDGSERLFRAVADAEVPALVYASSVGVYSRGPAAERVDESWPRDGIASSYYSRHKVAVERLLDRFEGDAPSTRVARLRPALIFKAEAAEEIRRLFAGPFLPRFLLEPGRLPVVPVVSGIRFQAVHSLDVGEAFRLAVTREVDGAFNIAADGILTTRDVAGLLRARGVGMPFGVTRAAADLAWKLRLTPSSAGWLDMARDAPLLDTRRARTELGWEPRHDAREAFAELLLGIREGRGARTPPLHPETSGPARTREVATGVGARQGVAESTSERDA